VFAPHSALRAEVTPAGRGRSTGAVERSPAERHRALRWAQRLKRVFRIEIELCERCGGKVRIIASIEDPEVIGRVLAHLEPRASAPAGLIPAQEPRGAVLTVPFFRAAKWPAAALLLHSSPDCTGGP
jgi:hypothetical protein